LLVTGSITTHARASAIDALRGLAIVGMILAAAQPAGVLPAWMYHAQNPPPLHDLHADIAGLTWTDLVFPFFIFSLGAAIPLALSRRLDAGASYASLLRAALARAALLVFFAWFRQHFDAALSGLQPPAFAWGIALAAFAVLFGIFVRLPAGWSRQRRAGLRAAAWMAAILMFALVRFPDGSRFRPERIDMILLILAYCVLLGTLVWLATRRAPIARLVVLAAVAVMSVAAQTVGWAGVLHRFDVPWIYRFSFVTFLCGVIPGTLAGDLLETARYAHPGVTSRWSRARTAGLAAALLASVPLVLVGVQTRQVGLTVTLAAALCAALWRLSRHPGSTVESQITQLLPWGCLWLLLGLVLDPLQGGTRKAPETLAWFFQTSGLAIFVLLGFTIAVEIWKWRRGPRLLIDIGQNPMIGYVGYGMVVLPLLGLTSVSRVISAQSLAPWVLFCWGVVLTFAVALMVQGFTRRGVFWRS